MRGYTKDTPIKEAMNSYTLHTHEQVKYGIIPVGYFDIENIPDDIEYEIVKNSQVLYLDHEKLKWSK